MIWTHQTETAKTTSVSIGCIVFDEYNTSNRSKYPASKMTYKYRLEDEPEIDDHIQYDQNTYTLWKNSTISRLPDHIYLPLYHIQRQNVRIPLIKIFNNYYRLSPISNRQVTMV